MNLEPGEESDESIESTDQGWEPTETGELAAPTPLHPTAETSVAAAPAPQRRIRSGRPRLPREVIAATRAASEAAAVLPAQELLAPPPPPSLEYPVAEEDAALASRPPVTMPELAPEPAIEAPMAESMVPALEPVAPAEASEPVVEPVANETSEPVVEPVAAEQPEALLQPDTGKVAAAPTVSMPEDVGAETPSVEKTIAASVASETEAAVTAEAATDASPPGEAAEPAAKDLESTGSTPSPETAAEDKPAA